MNPKPLRDGPATTPPVIAQVPMTGTRRRPPAWYRYGPIGRVLTPEDCLMTRSTYGGPWITKGGTRVHMTRGPRNASRWIADNSGRRIGPEQSNVALAIAYALKHGWRQL